MLAGIPKRAIVTLAAASTLFLTTGCGGSDEATSETPTVEASQTPTSEATGATPTESDSPADALTHADPAARAAQGALVAVPGGAVISIDPESGDVWSVLVRTPDGSGTEVYVNAATGEVVRQQSEPLPAEARAAAPTVTAIAAIDTALAARPGAVRELDLGTEQSVVVWEILVRNGGETEFYIDAATGAVVKQEAAD